MYDLDHKHMSFITNRGMYCYKVIPFGLINTRATYQRLVNMMFRDQIDKTMEVYVDDMLVKLKNTDDHVKHLGEMFTILRNYQMKLNRIKCVFGEVLESSRDSWSTNKALRLILKKFRRS